MGKFKNTNSIRVPARAVGAILLLSMTCLPAQRVWAEDFDAGVENEAVMANSEGAIAEAEEAKKREDAERVSDKKAQKLAEAEAAHAKKVEADAKVTMGKAMNEEARLKKEREAAEARKQAATNKIKETDTELQARQTQLDVLRELTDKTVADRDQLEAQVKGNNDKLHVIDQQIAAEKKRRSDSEAALIKSKERLAKSNQKVQEANNRLNAVQTRSPSSVNTTTSREGWIKLKKDCGLNTAADQGSAQTQALKAGDRLYARKVDSNWIEIRDKTAGSTTGFVAIDCVR